jgi:hypothetical protein
MFDFEPPNRWVDIDRFPCALADDGTLRCFVDPTRGDLPKFPDWSETRAVELAGVNESYGLAMGLDAEGYPLLLHCEYSHLCEMDPSQPLISASLLGGVTEDGELVSTGWLLVPQFAAAAFDRQFVAHSVTHEPMAIALDASPTQMVEIFTDGIRRDVCILTASGQVVCESAAGTSVETELPFGDGSYSRLEGQQYHACAQRTDGGLVCTDGSAFDWGPLVTMDAGTMPDPEAPGYPANAVCVVTACNTIECEGSWYTDDVQDQLRRTNETHRLQTPECALTR